jgi:hypothetical protein
MRFPAQPEPAAAPPDPEELAEVCGGHRPARQPKIQNKQAMLTKQGFTNQLQKVINKGVSQEDVDLFFQVFDHFNKGFLKKSEFQIIMNEIRQ